MREITELDLPYFVRRYSWNLFVNFAVNFLFGLWHEFEVIPLYGHKGLLQESTNLCLFVAGIMSFFVILDSHEHVKKGITTPPSWHRESIPILKYLPRNYFYRASIFAVISLTVFGPIVAYILITFNVQSLPRFEFAVLKGLYAMLIAGSIDPIVRISALGDTHSIRKK